MSQIQFGLSRITISARIGADGSNRLAKEIINHQPEAILGLIVIPGCAESLEYRFLNILGPARQIESSASADLAAVAAERPEIFERGHLMMLVTQNPQYWADIHTFVFTCKHPFWDSELPQTSQLIESFLSAAPQAPITIAQPIHSSLLDNPGHMLKEKHSQKNLDSFIESCWDLH